jgi:hypothetical protein
MICMVYMARTLSYASLIDKSSMGAAAWGEPIRGGREEISEVGLRRSSKVFRGSLNLDYNYGAAVSRSHVNQYLSSIFHLCF